VLTKTSGGFGDGRGAAFFWQPEIDITKARKSGRRYGGENRPPNIGILLKNLAGGVDDD
jgi:hypothetical protein